MQLVHRSALLVCQTKKAECRKEDTAELVENIPKVEVTENVKDWFYVFCPDNTMIAYYIHHNVFQMQKMQECYGMASHPGVCCTNQTNKSTTVVALSGFFEYGIWSVMAATAKKAV
jgi:hypothetical protein